MFTPSSTEEDEKLVDFLVQKRPDGVGRTGKRLYEDLVNDVRFGSSSLSQGVLTHPIHL